MSPLFETFRHSSWLFGLLWVGKLRYADILRSCDGCSSSAFFSLHVGEEREDVDLFSCLTFIRRCCRQDLRECADHITEEIVARNCLVLLCLLAFLR